MDEKEKIIKLSKENGIDIIGFTNLKYNEEIQNFEKEMQNLGYLTPFHKKFDKNEFTEYKTAIVIGVSYYNDKILSLDSLPEEIAYFSVSSWGEDYHLGLKRKLNLIKEYLETIGSKSEIYVDNNSLNERYLAYRAGLGFFGVNGNLINDRLGSYFFIGVLLTDKEFPYDNPIKKTCLSCMKCVKSCPTHAIDMTGKINGNICLSYITQKKEITKEEESLITRCIYGCDICNKVCPHNSKLKNSNNFPLLGVEFIDVKKYKKLSNKEFKEKYGKLSGAWRGKKVIERNISIYKEKLEKNSIK